ncbi:hypothetical protein [Halorarius litoreus]|uniref:hypothetical protein n=1 Tax=Halorarius litoreus TaxID=2962676 RepID=UPI0020CF45F4|nr:hypothetical protein [Halorarius litoreus]
MTARAGLRETLLDHSDHQACRNVWQAVTGESEAVLPDYVETMRATDGAVALVAQDGAADVYARFSKGRFEHLTLWPPWTIGGVDHTDRAGLESYLADTSNLRPIPHDDTPFASPKTLGSMSHRIWP